MATYYVRPDGNDTNSGLGPATNLAWATMQKAMSTIVYPQDVIYIAPGVYRGQITASFTNPWDYTQRINYNGDPTGSQFPGVAPGPVVITNFTSNTTYISASNIINIQKDYLTFRDITFHGYVPGSAPYYGNLLYFRGTKLVFERCQFMSYVVNDAYPMNFVIPAGQLGYTFESCTFVGKANISGEAHTSDWNPNTTVKKCLFLNISNQSNNQDNLNFVASGVWQYGGATVSNNVFISSRYGVSNIGQNSSQTYPIIVKNNIFYTSDYSIFALNHGQIVESYNIFVTVNPRNVYVVAGTGSYTNPMHLFNLGMSRVQGWNQNLPFFASLNVGLANNIGTSSGAASSDFNNTAWNTPSTPTIGAFEYTFNDPVEKYMPLERQVESFTVSPNTTNRSELIYLGAKGLTHTTPSLSSSYVRAGGIRTAITLVSQTPNGSWTSGGFCEIDSTNMPGIYRIDVPNAVFVAGAESAMLQLTGTNQTNGAVVHYNMAKVQFDLSQNVPLVNTAHSIGDALNAARAQGFGKWQIVGNTMNIYAEDGITLVKSFNLDSGSYPTQRM
jgi:hypothetical protein